MEIQQIRTYIFNHIKSLVSSEYEEIFRIIRKKRESFSENSNGIFFDVSSLPSNIFEALWKFIEFCKSNAKNLEERSKMIDVMNNK